MMRLRRSLSVALWALAGAGCSSVELPEQRFYGLAAQDAVRDEPVVDVLRVFDLVAMGAFDRDHIVVTDGTRYAARPLSRWVVPTDRMLTDGLVLGLSRRGVAELVLGTADPGRESWRLHGRIVEFAEHHAAAGEPAGNLARISVEVWLLIDERLAFRDEFAAVEPIEGDDVEAAVAALSRGFDRVVADVAARVRRATPPPAAGASGNPSSPRR